MLVIAFTCCDNPDDCTDIVNMAYKVPYDTIPNFIDFHQIVKCSKKCCFVDFTVKKLMLTVMTLLDPFLQ